jgi:hypothetical protein
MPQVMKKFVRANLPKQIYRNASLGQKNLVKANMNRTRFTLKQIWGQFLFLFLFLVHGICKLLCWYLIYSYKFANKIISFQEALQFKVAIVLCLLNITAKH